MSSDPKSKFKALVDAMMSIHDDPECAAVVDELLSAAIYVHRPMRNSADLQMFIAQCLAHAYVHELLTPNSKAKHLRVVAP